MVYLNLALYAEGRTDYQFLLPLLKRLTEQVCLAEVPVVIAVGDVLPLDDPPRFRGADRATRVLEAARSFWGGTCILFIHADGASDPRTKAAEQIEPGRRLIRSELRGGACVAVVPVRETEAWALVDGNALRDAFGTTLDDKSLQIVTRPREVEDIQDPKKRLEDAFRAVVSQRRRSNVGDFYERIGERVALAPLRQLPAFIELENDLRRALRALGRPF